MQKPWQISPVVAASPQGPSTLRDTTNVASIIYRVICAEYDLEHSKDWWVEPEKVVRNAHQDPLGLSHPD